MWDLPGPGIELVSPALAGGFLTTAPSGKSLYSVYDTIFGEHKNQIAHHFLLLNMQKPFILYTGKCVAIFKCSFKITDLI